MEGLLPPLRPAGAPAFKRGFECRWEEVSDQNGQESLPSTKIGGYPSTVQSEPWWDYQDHPAQPEYCLQVKSEEKVGLAWGDAGMVYLARGTTKEGRSRWFLDWQCY